MGEERAMGSRVEHKSPSVKGKNLSSGQDCCSRRHTSTDIIAPRQSSISSASRIRSRFLSTIGILDESKQSLTRSHGIRTRTSLLRTSRRFCEELKADHGLPDEKLIIDCRDVEDTTCSTASLDTTLTSCGSFTPSHCEGRARCVSFGTLVEVVPIPSHHDYSPRIRNVLWNDSRELQSNAIRNYVEFIAEGWDWKSVVDESDMVNINGELVHPVHFHDPFPECNVNLRFCAALSVQRRQYQE